MLKIITLKSDTSDKIYKDLCETMERQGVFAGCGSPDDKWVCGRWENDIDFLAWLTVMIGGAILPDEMIKTGETVESKELTQAEKFALEKVNEELISTIKESLKVQPEKQYTAGELLINALNEIGADGLVNSEHQCGCGDREGWFLCCDINLDDCRAAKWRDCQECSKNGQCDYQREYEVTDGCYYVLEEGMGRSV